MHKISILLIFGLAFALVPYSYGESCTMSDVTVIDEKGIELGACKNPDNNTGKKFTYVSKANAACCKAETGRFKTLCIHYSLCKGEETIKPLCPINNPNYKFIDNVCYFFEATKLSFEDAKQNCQTKFGKGFGKLWESFTFTQQKPVLHSIKCVK